MRVGSTATGLLPDADQPPRTLGKAKRERLNACLALLATVDTQFLVCRDSTMDAYLLEFLATCPSVRIRLEQNTRVIRLCRGELVLHCTLAELGWSRSCFPSRKQLIRIYVMPHGILGELGRMPQVLA
jgi:hypothetical protein